MPNGGSDCCGTCWFNRANRGERDWLEHRDKNIPPYCEIRKLAIKDPFYTYCANHPHRMPDRDPIPIGPVTRHGGFRSRKRSDGVIEMWEDGRYVWKPSPDTEEIRQHLLNLLATIFERLAEDQYPLGIGIGEAIVRQLGEFREPRAAEHLEWIRDNLAEVDDLDYLVRAASKALARIREDD